MGISGRILGESIEPFKSLKIKDTLLAQHLLSKDFRFNLVPQRNSENLMNFF